MKLDSKKWTLNDYNKYIEYLKSLQDKNYLEFNKKLINSKYQFIGIRVPIMRKIAFKIAKGNIISFLEFNKGIYYEEVFIKGLVIAHIKDIKLNQKYIDNYVTQIDNWGICDSFCNSLNIVQNNYSDYFNYFSNFLKSDNEFRVRVALVVFLNFYLTDFYIDKILMKVKEIKNEKYYVEMAISWLLAEAYVTYKKKVFDVLNSECLTKFVHNKTISKICDSYRVSKEEKEVLKKLKW